MCPALLVEDASQVLCRDRRLIHTRCMQRIAETPRQVQCHTEAVKALRPQAACIAAAACK